MAENAKRREAILSAFLGNWCVRLTRYWTIQLAVRCGWLFGAFPAQEASAAAYLALRHWVAEREGSADSLLRCPITIVVPAGGRAPEDYLHLRTRDLLSDLGLLSRHRRSKAITRSRSG